VRHWARVHGLQLVSAGVWLRAIEIGATENARPDIARLDNAAPYRKGGHRETCFSVRVDAHYKFMFDSGSII